MGAELALNPPARPSRLRLALAGAALGLGWGAAARAWMRLIATEPRFSWSGTGYILGAFTVIGLLLGAAEASRRRGAMRWWRATALSVLLLGVGGAGFILVPTVLLGGLAVGRRRWPPTIRAVLGLVAAAPVAFVAHHVWTTFPGLRGVFAIVIWLGLAVTLTLAFSVPFHQSTARGPEAPPREGLTRAPQS